LAFILLGLVSARHFRTRLLLASAGYVVPVFCCYIRAEEPMMESEFGMQFEDHRRRVAGYVLA
jgi:protein-S-isoprenylcysteine O-methyltransferase Ste14